MTTIYMLMEPGSFNLLIKGKANAPQKCLTSVPTEELANSKMDPLVL